MPKLLNIISNPDFWRGLTYVLTAAGVMLKPDQQQAILAAGLALSGCLHAFCSVTGSK